MENKSYYTVKEMSDSFNELIETLNNAWQMAGDLVGMNVRNKYAIIRQTGEAVAEQRPLTMDERKEEAGRYIALFQKVKDLISDVSDLAYNNY